MKTNSTNKKGIRLLCYLLGLVLSMNAQNIEIIGDQTLCLGACNDYALRITDFTGEYMVVYSSWDQETKRVCSPGELYAEVTFQSRYYPSDRFTQSTSITIYEKPIQLSAISGPTHVDCLSSTPVTYSVAADCPGLTYYWSLPLDWQGSSTTNSITVTPSALDGGQVKVYAKSNSGSVSATSVLTVSRASVAPVLLNPVTQVCSGLADYRVVPIPGVAYYSWSVPGANIVNGQGTEHIQVQFPRPGVYTVSVKTSGFCGISDITSVNVNYGPPAGSVSLHLYASGNCKINGTGTAVPNTLYYEWSQNNFATVSNTTYSPNPPLDVIDDYTTIYVRPVNNCGSGEVSFVYVNPDYLCFDNGKDHRENLSENKEKELMEVLIFPNPARDAFEISIPDHEGYAGLKLFNAQGQLLKAMNMEGKKSVKLDIPDVPEGIYFLHLELENMSVVKKVQVIK